MRRLIQIVMVVVLLLSGPMLPASAMPCCVGTAGMVKTVSAVAASQDDAMDMASCNHASAQVAAPHADASMDEMQSAMVSDCVHGLCAFRGNVQPVAFEVSERQQDLAALAPLQIAVVVPALSAGVVRGQMTVRPPLLPAAMPLPLRV